jgi:hypothetical protein
MAKLKLRKFENDRPIKVTFELSAVEQMNFVMDWNESSSFQRLRRPRKILRRQT